MAINWYPLTAGQKLTAEMFNELVAAIQDGSIFTSVSFVSSLVTTLDTRVSTLEAEVSTLNLVQATAWVREQIDMTAGQSIVNLNHVPVTDSEVLFINGMSIAKSGIPVGRSADYSLSGSIVTFVNELALQIQDGDVLVVVYQYNV